MLINAKNTFEEISLINNWKKWLNGVNFLDKYKHYLLILCISTHYNLKENVNYCNYVESRIRLELVFSIEDDNLIKYAHAFSKENWLPNKIKQKFGGHITQHWWIGIETYEQIIQIEIYNSIEGNILKNFVDRIQTNTPIALRKSGGWLEMFYYNKENDKNIFKNY
uniref:Poly(A) polymerase RNA-binding domain-containing protein n=1 Tax=Meloidogyne enterolobii TaxID=390850 RepID=A0A6V7Y660_MELEN|nr:unnamed protein product [Meloidogyne enterolobii]